MQIALNSGLFIVNSCISKVIKELSLLLIVFCCITANYKFSVLDNLNAKQKGLYRIYRSLLIHKILQRNNSESYGSFRAMAEETVRD